MSKKIWVPFVCCSGERERATAAEQIIHIENNGQFSRENLNFEKFYCLLRGLIDLLTITICTKKKEKNSFFSLQTENE